MFLSCRPFVVSTTFSTGIVGVEVSSVCWLGQFTVCVFKSLIIVIVGFQNFVCCLAVYLAVQITDEGRRLYIGSFCPTMTSLRRFRRRPLLVFQSLQVCLFIYGCFQGVL